MGLERLGADWVPLVLRALGNARSGPPDGSTGAGLSARLGAYLDEVVDWNERIDLTAARSAEELVDLTVADAAVVARASSASGTWIDVGSGAGAPGLSLAMMLPAATLTLVEPQSKRVAFLRHVIGKLGLANVTVERARSDRIPDHAYDVAVSRATLPPDEWLVEGARIARACVWVLLAAHEPPAFPDLRLDLDVQYEWPLTHARRRAARYTTAKE